MSDRSTTPARFAAVTPNDTTTLSQVIGLYVGTTGNLAVAGNDGTVVTFASVPAGTYLRGHFSKVMLTNTTAGNIVACLSE